MNEQQQQQEPEQSGKHVALGIIAFIVGTVLLYHTVSRIVYSHGYSTFMG
jgi:hypothetical protein